MWEQIRSNQRKSAILVFSMALLLLVMGYVIGEAFQPGAGVLGLFVAAVIFLVQMMTYYFAGDSIFLFGTGAKEITHEQLPQLYNIVEEMKIAGGLGFMPKIYVLPTNAPNAFAVGRKPENSAVAVTQGLLHRLNRDELQGVIAHEIAHLKNADTKFMMLAAVMLGTIIILSETMLRGFQFGAGRSSSRSSSRGDSNNQGQVIVLLIALVLMIIGPILAQILYFSISRSREFLADASAAQFTRYPEGLASALIKISRTQSSMGEISKVTAPMYIINPLKADGGSLLSTHPPTEKRVQVLRAMGGASYSDYNEAFKRVTGKNIIGGQTLAAAEHMDVRPAVDAGPIESKREIRSAVNELNGYINVLCPCGVELKIPPTFKSSHITCMRCGTKTPSPLSQTVKPPMASQSSEIPIPPQMFVRQSLGWESITCRCGASINLSPSFSAPNIRCNSCNNSIQVVNPIHGSQN